MGVCSQAIRRRRLPPPSGAGKRHPYTMAQLHGYSDRLLAKFPDHSLEYRVDSPQRFQTIPTVVKSDSRLFQRGSWRRGVCVVGLSLVGAALLHGRTPMQEELAAQLPKFAPDGATAPKPATGVEEVKNRATLIRLPAAEPAKPAASEPPKEIIVLPQVTVTGKSVPAQSSGLPKLNVTRPVKDLPAVPFETAGARDERLVKKHLTPFDYLFLNRFTLPFIGISKEARGRGC